MPAAAPSSDSNQPAVAKLVERQRHSALRNTEAERVRSEIDIGFYLRDGRGEIDGRTLIARSKADRPRKIGLPVKVLDIPPRTRGGAQAPARSVALDVQRRPGHQINRRQAIPMLARSG